MITLLEKAKTLESEIKEFLYLLQKSGLLFQEAVQEFMNRQLDDFQKRVADVRKVDSDADKLKRRIKHKLYRNSLIPDERGDIWDLIESLDSLLDVLRKVMENFYFEKPSMPSIVKKHFVEIATLTQKTIEELTNATNAYFTNHTMVSEFVNQVLVFEHEIDKTEDMLKKTIFVSDEFKTLSHRLQLRYFTEKMALVSDVCELVSEKLSVFVMKGES